MSIIGVAAAAAAATGAGKVISGFLFNYTKKEYEDRISEIEALATKLQDHLTDMEKLKGEIKDFWDDDRAQETYMNLNDTIVNTGIQLKNVKDYMQSLRKIVDEMDRSGTLMDETLEDVRNLLSIGK